MPKQEKFPTRPKPPTTKEIEIDWTTSNPSDIAFMLFRNDRMDNSSTESANLMTESFIFHEDITDKAEIGSSSITLPQEDQSEEIEKNKKHKKRELIYNETVQFLEMSESLKEAPENLKNKYQQLTKLGIQLKESIESLKKHSQDALKCSTNSDESVEDLK